MPSRSSHGADTKSTKADGSKSGSGTRKLFQSLALGLIEYSAEKYLKRDRSSPESSDAHSKSSHRSTRSRGPTTERTPVGRSGSSSTSRGDVTAVLGQLTIGLGALLVRQYLKHRKARKEKAKEEARIRDAQKKGQRVEGDPELRAGLDSLAGEAQRTSQSLRDIARTPPTHPNCEVVGALDQNADRLQQSLSNIQTGVHNIRNLRDDRLGRDGPAPRQRERKPDMDGERTRDRNRDWDQERARERERARFQERVRERERERDRRLRRREVERREGERREGERREGERREGERRRERLRSRRVYGEGPDRFVDMERAQPRWKQR